MTITVPDVGEVLVRAFLGRTPPTRDGGAQRGRGKSARNVALVQAASQARQMSPGLYRTSPVKRVRRTNAQIAAVRRAIYGTLAADHPQTVRGVYYQLVVQEVVPKTEAGYTVVQRQLLLMRRCGELPYVWITDGTRLQRKPASYAGLDDFYFHAAQVYRRDLWAGQHVHLEVWCEKDALSGVLFEETAVWDVPLMTARGFSSESFLYATAEAIKADEQPTYLYHFGDHDPSGLLIDQQIERGLRRLAPDAEIHFVRLAVTPAQIDAWHLPTRPTKRQGNAHARAFHGRSVEVDAIPAARLRELVREAILPHVNPHALQTVQVAEASEHDLLRKLFTREAHKHQAPAVVRAFEGILEQRQHTLSRRWDAHREAP
jgi:hypothetical protein